MDHIKLKDGKLEKSEEFHDKRTLQKRNDVKKKIYNIINDGDDIEEILISIEKYCQIILESL